MSDVFGVGVIGAGPVTQAIHLPTLARMPDRFRVTAIMDVDEPVAESVAGRVGARHSTSADDLIGDPGVDVVAVCSPHRFHAEQVEAACYAGKAAVLCEKPLALTVADAERVAQVSRETGVPVIVGAMHTFDPGWLGAKANWGDLQETVRVVNSSIVLPWNARYEDWATQILRRPPPGEPVADDALSRSVAVRDAVLGLAVHNLPHVRHFLPDVESVDWAESVDPYGYLVTIRGGGIIARLLGNMHGYWKPSWTLDAWAADQSLHVEFPPSYVQAGSSVATLTSDTQTRRFGGVEANGYEAEWLRVWELAAGIVPQGEDLQATVDDLIYAVRIADAAADLVRGEHARDRVR
ncbi:MAG: Gfo/Idh/MocA family oxidoreductase [Rhodoglobus sp.]|nr:Gfo/Idh/MocA family oxidoreductase [Rhodoglobus sp.]